MITKNKAQEISKYLLANENCLGFDDAFSLVTSYLDILDLLKKTKKTENHCQCDFCKKLKEAIGMLRRERRGG